MKKMLVAAVVAAFSAAQAAETMETVQAEQATESAQVTQSASTNALSRAERLRMVTGGFVFDKRNARGRAGFISMQGAVGREALEKEAEQLERELMFRVEVSGADAPADAGIESFAAAAKAGGLDMTVIISDTALPASLMLFPEQRFAVVNVRELAKDSPGKATLESRVRKEMARALSLLFGSGYTVLHRSALSPASGSDELDELPLGRLPTETSSVVQRIAVESFGFRLYRRAFYATALKEGWAPPPKGAYQKALWEQSRQAPSNPLVIDYDPEKGR